MSYTATLNGLTIGAAPYRLEKAPAGFGVTARGGRVPNANGGRLPTGRDVAEGREMVFELSVLAATDVDVEPLVDALLAAWAPSATWNELTVELAGAAKVRRGRAIAADADYELLPAGAAARARVVFEALDPLWYSASVSTVVLSLAAGVVGGFGEPFGEPFGEGTTGGSSDATVSHTGTAPSPWTAVLAGPLTFPVLRLGSDVLTINGDIPAGSLLTIDSRTQAIALDGSPRPWAAFDAGWFDIPASPMAATLSLRAQAGTGTATVSWRPASY